jgi:hypothetical protein
LKENEQYGHKKQKPIYDNLYILRSLHMHPLSGQWIPVRGNTW